jgi:hypothetical protein
MPMSQALRAFVLKPWLWTTIVAVVAYWDGDALRGGFVYDDNGSIKSNVVVNGNVPFSEVSLLCMLYSIESRLFVRLVMRVDCLCSSITEACVDFLTRTNPPSRSIRRSSRATFGAHQ